MQLIPFLLVGCVAAVVAQLPPRPEQIPGAEPVREPAPQRLSQYRRPTHRAYQDQPQQQQPERVIRVRRPTSRGRHVAVPPQPKQDYVSLTPRPVSEDPDSDFDAPAPPPPTRGAVSGRVLANRPLYLQPAVYRNARPAAPPALQGGFRPLANEDDNAVLPSRPSSPSPRAYLPGTGPNAPSGAPAGTAAPLLDLPLPDPPQQQHQQQQQQQQQQQHQQHQQQQRPVFRGPPAPLTAIPAAQLQLAQQLAQQQQHAVHQVQQSSATSVSPSASPSPASVEDDDEEEDNDAVSNPNRRQSLQSLTPFKVTPGNFLVTPSTLELDDDLPQSGFTPSVPRRPQQQPQVFRPSPILDLDNNAFSPAPRPQPPQQPQHQQIQRRPSPPPPAPAPATPSPARRPVLFRPERVNQVSPAPAPNVHVHQLLREDDDYLPVARPTPAPRPVRPQPTPQPQPRPVVKPRPPGNTGGSKYQRDKKPVAQVLRRYREDNPDGSITWGYENDDGSFKEETIGVDCMVRGKYGYIDPDGNRREYTYQSGIPCTPAPPGQQADDQEGGYIDYQNNQYVLPNGDAIDLDNMVKNRKRKPVAKNRNFS